MKMVMSVSEIWIEMYLFSLKKIHLKMSFAKWWSFCLGLNVSSAVPVCILKPTLAVTSPKDILAQTTLYHWQAQ